MTTLQNLKNLFLALLCASATGVAAAKSLSPDTPLADCELYLVLGDETKLKNQDETFLLAALDHLLSSPDTAKAPLENEQRDKIVVAILKAGRSEFFFHRAQQIVTLYGGLQSSAWRAQIQRNLLPREAPEHADTLLLTDPSVIERTQGAAREAFEATVQKVIGTENPLFARELCRRIFAYLKKNAELSQKEKYHLLRNLLFGYSLKGNISYILVPRHQDGTEFILSGHGNRFFFAITPDAQGAEFFHGRKSNQNGTENAAYHTDWDWRPEAILHKAGEPRAAFDSP